MAQTYEPIQTTTLTTAETTINFNTITGAYTDLVLVAYLQMSSSGNTVYSTVNNAAANYLINYISGGTQGPSAGRGTDITFGYGLGGWAYGYSSGRFTIVAHFLNYSNTTTHKTILSNWADASANNEMFVNIYPSTTAISSIQLKNNGTQTFNVGSQVTLYGITKA
jgi:hypothetical protein